MIGKKKADKKKSAKVNEVNNSSVVHVPDSENPLYPPKKESTGKEMGVAVGTAIVCLLLCSLIIGNFNYGSIYARKHSSGNNSYVSQDSGSGNENSQSESAEQEETTAESQNQENASSNESRETIGAALVTESSSEAIDQEYILPFTSERLVTEEELALLTDEELHLASNEIYARHGRKFKDAAIQAYFDSKDWYEGYIEPDDFTESYAKTVMSELELQNAVRIRNAYKARTSQ